ncbi:MAG: hypothetical protein GXP44_02325 [bacterium]|nr:hypothetical protein [bacterium]
MVDPTNWNQVLLIVAAVAAAYILYLVNGLIRAEHSSSWERAGVSAIFGVAAGLIIWGIGIVVGVTVIGRPAPFNQLAERIGITYEVGNSAGEKGTFWILSKDGSRIFKGVPGALRMPGVRFVLLGNRIVIVRKEVFPTNKNKK